MILTRKDLEEIKARAENATEGPWETFTDPHYDGYTIESPKPTSQVSNTVHYRVDADFIAYARTDIPSLVETIETLVRILQSEQELKEGKWRVLK